MKKEEKIKLYEYVMRQLAPIVTTHIEKYSASNSDVMFCKEQKRLDEAFKKIFLNFNRTVDNLTKNETDEMCVDYLDRFQTVSSIFLKPTVMETFGNFSSGGIINETFTNENDFRLSFEKIKSTLTRTFGMREAYVELYNPTGHGTLAFVKQPIDASFKDDYIISTIVPVINKNMN